MLVFGNKIIWYLGTQSSSLAGLVSGSVVVFVFVFRAGQLDECGDTCSAHLTLGVPGCPVHPSLPPECRLLVISRSEGLARPF